jgi:hypothetical protein
MYVGAIFVKVLPFLLLRIFLFLVLLFKVGLCDIGTDLVFLLRRKRRKQVRIR